MADDSKQTISISKQFEAPAEQVFDAWLDPATARRFLFNTPSGEMIRAEIDAKVGGDFNFTDRREGQDIEHVGKYVEISRPVKLVFTFGVPFYSDEETLVTLEIEPRGSGCHVTVTNDGIPPEWAEPTRQGWTAILMKQESVICGGSRA